MAKGGAERWTQSPFIANSPEEGLQLAKFIHQAVCEFSKTKARLTIVEEATPHPKAPNDPLILIEAFHFKLWIRRNTSLHIPQLHVAVEFLRGARLYDLRHYLQPCATKRKHIEFLGKDRWFGIIEEGAKPVEKYNFDYSLEPLQQLNAILGLIWETCRTRD